MTIVRARLAGMALPLRRPMTTAHGRIEARRGLIVTLVDADGRRGFGEATPLPDFGTEDLATCRATLERRLARLLDEDPATHAASTPPPAPSATPCADFAIETAQADLEARARGVRLVDLYARAAGRAGPADAVESQVVVAGETPEEVARQARAALASGAVAFKLKVAASSAAAPGAGDLALDAERVAALREGVGAGARLRLDANEGWTEPQAEAALTALARFDVDYVEQPVAREDVAAMARLDRARVVAVAADEALQAGGWQACLEARAASAFVLKPAALGGWQIAATIAERARSAGIRTVWSTLIDGAVGRGSAIALAAALGEPGEVHGLGTADWLASDLAPRSEAEGASRVRIGPGPGLGFEPVIDAALADGPTLVFETEGVGR